MEKAGGNDFKWDIKAQRDEISRRGAHVAYGTTPRVVSLVENKEFLATTGGRNRRWDGR